jgi:hypothetical protein
MSVLSGVYECVLECMRVRLFSCYGVKKRVDSGVRIFLMGGGL